MARRGPEPRSPRSRSPSEPAPERGQRPDGSNLSSQETLSDFLAILPVPPATHPARPPRQEAGAAGSPPAASRRSAARRAEPPEPGPRGAAVLRPNAAGPRVRVAAAFVSAWGVGARQPERPWAREPPQVGEELGWPRLRWKDGPEEAGPGASKVTETPTRAGPSLLGDSPKESLLQGPRRRALCFSSSAQRDPVVKCEEETGSLRPER